MDLEIGKVDLDHAVALAFQADHTLIMEGDNSDDVQIDRRA